MRSLFLICIIFSLISWGVVFPINRKQENGGFKKKENPQEKPIEKRECNRFQNFVGSNLFDGIRKVCFSHEDINLLVARRQFEIMIPKELPPGLLDEKTVNHILRYFYHGFWQFRRMEDGSSRRIMEKAFYDTLGGFLRYYLVPVCKFSYYASKVELRTVRNVLFLYQKCRDFLNTNGNGWRMPMRNPMQELKSVKIKPIKITEDEKVNADRKVCSDLDLTPSNNGIEVVDDFMIVPLPKLDVESSDGYLNNIWLPFAKKQTYNLKSCKSAFILVKYYRSVSRCYKKKSVPQKCFDRKFRQWIIENLKMHLSDDEFYPGLGGILNVYKNTLENEPSGANQTDDDYENDEVKKKRELSITIFDEGLQSSKTGGTLKPKELVATSYELHPLDELLDIVPQTKHLKCRPKCKKIQMKNQTSSKYLNKTDQAKATKNPNKGFSFKGCTLRYTLLGTTVLLILMILIALSFLLLKIYDGIEGFKRHFKGAFDKNDKKPKEKKAAKPKKEAKSKSSKSSKSSKASKKNDKAAKKKSKAKDSKKAKKDKDKKKSSSKTSTKGKDSKKAKKDKKRSSSKTSTKGKDSKKAEKEAKARAKKAEKEKKDQKKKAAKAEKASKKSGKSRSKSPKKDPKKSDKQAKKKVKEQEKKKKQKSGSESAKSSKGKKASGKKRQIGGSDVDKTRKEYFDGELVLIRSNRTNQKRGNSRIRSGT